MLADSNFNSILQIAKRYNKPVIGHVPLLVGTDMNFIGVYPGIATHRELELLTEAGLSPYEALKAATYNAAQCLGKLDEIGAISAGKQADLVLLTDNPLEKISNTRKIKGVMINGIWLDDSQLRNLKEK